MSEEYKEDYWKNEFQSREQGFDRKTFESENPYFQSHVHDEDGWMDTKTRASYDMEETHSFISRKIICLIFFAIALFSVIAAIIFTKRAKQNWLHKAYVLEYTEEAVDQEVSIYSNNTVFLPKTAYTMVSRDNFPTFPDGIKLIMVPFQITSDDYQSNSYPLRNLFIRYENSNSKESFFKEPARGSDAEIYLAGSPFKDNYRYAGNGRDEYAFAFFFVPADLKTCTLYIDKKQEDSPIEKLEYRFYKELEILPYDEAAILELTQLVKEGGM